MRALLLAISALSTLAGCSTVGVGDWPAPGTPAEALMQRWGPSTDTHTRPDGTRRLEFSQGPYGKTTYMVDLDSQGQVQRTQQVLDEAHFDQIRAGMSGHDVRSALGRPARLWAVRYHDQTVWSYRYESPFCRMFNVGFTPDGRVEDTSYGPDPLCDRKSRGNR